MKPENPLKKQKLEPRIVFEDDSIVVIDKPAHLLAIPDHWDKELPNVWHILQEKSPQHKIFVVHRLDAETSGLMIYAKNPEAHRLLCQNFEKHEVQKIYFALVDGNFKELAGKIELPLMEKPNSPGKMIISSRGKTAVTNWKVLEQFRGYSLLEVSPETGRMHQIRVHLKGIGHPLAIDSKYGESQAIFLSQLKPKYTLKTEEIEKPLMDRLTLHAGKLTFYHPDTRKQIQFESELPKDFRSLIRNLRKFRPFLIY
ncbi:RluA family pseudouridine synthase [candidate division KSB1 bacterium]|nr:RluA family pseudouridine synthase [candidate division KSB1 bacterium]